MIWPWLILSLSLIFGTGFFVTVEFCLLALDQGTVLRAVKNKDKGAAVILKCLKTLSTQLSSCQLGITLTTLLTGFVMEPQLARLFMPLLSAFGINESLARTASFVGSMIIATLLSMILGELVPKNLAIANPMKVARIVVRPQLFFTAVFKPFIIGFNAFSNWVLSLVGVEAQEEISGARTPEELGSLVRHSAELGTLDQATANFLAKTLNFAGRIAADAMTPRIRLVTLEVTQNITEVIDAARRSGLSRFPVIGETPDDIRGVVHLKKAIAVPEDKREELEVGVIMGEVLRVPETIYLYSLLAKLRDAGSQIAVVLDEYGGTAGIVTMEDLIEEVVGEVSDEHDRVSAAIWRDGDGSWYFPGIFRPDEVNNVIPGLAVPEDGMYETVGGFLMSELEKIPVVGDRVSLYCPVADHEKVSPACLGELEVARMDNRRVDRIKFIPSPEIQGSVSAGIRGIMDEARNGQMRRERGFL